MPNSPRSSRGATSLPGLLALLLWAALTCLPSAGAFANTPAEPATNEHDATEPAANEHDAAEAGSSATVTDRPRPNWYAFGGVIAFVLLLSRRRVIDHGSSESV